MKAEILTAALVLAILAGVLLTTDFLGRPDLVWDVLAFLAVAAVLGVRLWLQRGLRR